MLLERDDLPGVLERVGRRVEQASASEDVPHRRVHKGKAEDQQDLDPPIKHVAVAQHAGAGQCRSPPHLGAHARSSTERRFPRMNAGAPIMLTITNAPNHSKPAASACALLTPNVAKNSA